MEESKKRAALFAVFLAVLVDLMGFGIVLPLLPYTAGRFHASALTIGLLYSVYSLSQLVFSPLWGAWSDKVGRRPIMLLSTFGSCLSYVLFALSPSLMILFISRIAAGVMGGNISAAQAYVADVTKPEDRAKGMGLIGAAFGIGFAIGPAISGVLMMGVIVNKFPWLTNHPFALPGFVAAILSFASFCLVSFYLPESLLKNAVPDEARITKVSVFLPSFWKSAFSGGAGSLLSLLYFAGLILAVGNSTLYSAFPLFCRSQLHLGPDRVGFQFLWMGFVAILVQGGLIRMLVKRFGEKRLFIAGNILMSLGIASIAYANSESCLMIALGILALGASLNGPTLTSLVSKAAPPHRMGQALGTSQGMSALGRVIGPAWGGFLFAQHPQAPFLATALVLLSVVGLGFSPKLHEIS